MRLDEGGVWVRGAWHPLRPEPVPPKQLRPPIGNRPFGDMAAWYHGARYVVASFAIGAVVLDHEALAVRLELKTTHDEEATRRLAEHVLRDGELEPVIGLDLEEAIR